ncbi:hypothetical protein QTO34_007963 [Cnephaeus nilssonii]|uniref:Uncharacterized protein n=1 Tax=Cnephaeus nilssonii TaxID=3371016 RepID=A0AA40I9U0_CNENI|nr:hypothetical protein QTO34_007963 [Eptesicus nilssonii]
MGKVLLAQEDLLALHFYVREAEIISSRGRMLESQTVETEKVLSIIYQPQAIFKIHAVCWRVGIFEHSREAVDYAPDRVVSADTRPGLEIGTHGPFPARRPYVIEHCQLSEEQDDLVNNMVVNGMTLTVKESSNLCISFNSCCHNSPNSLKAIDYTEEDSALKSTARLLQYCSVLSYLILTVKRLKPKKISTFLSHLVKLNPNDI